MSPITYRYLLNGLFWTLILYFLCAGKADAGLAVTAQDPFAPVFKLIYSEYFPKAYQTDKKPVYMTSVSGDALRLIAESLAPGDPRVSGIVGLCLTADEVASLHGGLPYGMTVLLISSDQNGDEFLMTSVHELGHYFEDDLLSEKQRTAWIQIYGDELLRNALPDVYATFNDREGFAESFMFWRLHPTSLDAETRLFLEKQELEHSPRRHRLF